MTLPKYIAASYKLSLHPLTPIHVWAGTVAKYKVDSDIVGNKFYAVTYEDLEKLLPSLGDKDLEDVSRDISNNQFPRRLVNLLKPIADAKASPAPMDQIRLHHRNIVPGSTLKGYIRTAVIRSLLSSLSKSNPVMAQKIITRGINLQKHTKPSRVSEKLEAKLLKKQRPGKVGGYVDLMELLHVSDPFASDTVKLSLRELRVVDRSDPRSIIAKVFAVVLDPDAVLEFRVDVINLTDIGARAVRLRKSSREGKTSKDAFDDIDNARRDLVSKLSNVNKFIEMLRSHGCSIIEAELKKIPSESEKLKEYKEKLSRWKEELCDAKSNCVPARIGFMTGREAKTIETSLGCANPEARRLRWKMARRWVV